MWEEVHCCGTIMLTADIHQNLSTNFAVVGPPWTLDTCKKVFGRQLMACSATYGIQQDYVY